MMGENLRFKIDLDAQPLHDKLNAVDSRAEAVKAKTDAIFEEVEAKRRMSFQQVVSMAQMSWSVMDATLRALGINVSMQFRLLMRTGFAAIRVLTPLLTAQAMTPGMKAQAALGLLNLSLAISALQMTGSEYTQAQTQLAAATEALAGINSMVGMLNFLW